MEDQSGYDKVRLRLNGQAALLMHNGAMADKRNPFVQSIGKITGKGKNKTDADLLELSRLEFLGGIYANGNGPMLPAELLFATLLNGAKKSKQGPVFKAGVIIENHADLIYEGPRSPEKMWKSGDYHYTCRAKVGQSSVMRTRPRFDEWAVEFDVSFLPEVVDRETVIEAANKAGLMVGLGDWRPQYGRFTVEVVE